MDLYSERECYRGTMELRTPDGERATLIVLRRGQGRGGRVWITFDGALRTTVVMDNHESDKVTRMIEAAQSAR